MASVAVGVPVYQGVPEKSMAEKSVPLWGVPEKSVPEKKRLFPAWLGASDAGVDTLMARGYPKGLAKEVCASLPSTPLRFWVVDNSYSMNAHDGKRLVASAQGVRVLQSTRTAELKDAVVEQAEISSCVNARTDFHHLNHPSSAHQFVTLTSSDDRSGVAYAGATVASSGEAVEQLGRSIITCGSTPLTAAIIQIHTQLAPQAAAMRLNGQRAVIVIATDGMPNSPRHFQQALSQLQASCPVWIVVRLCTSDDYIVSYWSELDKQLESPLEVLDDVFGEAEEIGRVNDWLAYAPQLHSARLFGLQHKLFDLLDEHELLPSQARELTELLLGCGPLPEPELQPDAFAQALHAALAHVPPVYDARTHTMRPWVDVNRLLARLRAREALHAAAADHGLRLTAAELGALTSKVTRVVVAGGAASAAAKQALSAKVAERERQRATRELLQRLGLYKCIGGCVEPSNK